MDCKTLATSFIECFCNADLNGINALLAPKFHLKGPLFEFDTKEAYIESLKGKLEADPNSETLFICSNENDVAAFFTYQGNIIGQLFRCRGGEIYETLLVFDTAKVV